MEISLSGKRILVTGATGAIGRAIVEEALHCGGWVAGSYLANEAEAQSLRGQGVFLVQADLTDKGQARAMVAQVLKEAGELDALVYTAGNARDRTLPRMSDSDWEAVLRLHLDGLFACTQAVIPSMRQRRGGKIVAFGSLAGEIGRVGQANYAAAKAATVGFIKSVAREWGSSGISANVVCPGFVDSPMTRQAPPQAWEKARADSALGVISSVEVAASFTLWLLSDLAQGISGQVFHLDSRIF